MSISTLQRSLLIISIVLLPARLYPQQPTQTIRGTVYDEATNMTLAYATVKLMNSTVGAITDKQGFFAIKDVAVGRHSIISSYLGYESTVLHEILVTSAKEVVLTIRMKESTSTLGEVVVRANVDKEQPLNSMALVSTSLLSVEEAKCFAGGFDDPARLVSAFAGVSSNVQNNSIIVRGNSPQSLQWKLEGIEISNPNHFADLSSFGGGGITALSMQVLGNSDFFSGAMPAEYSNALSGVFDIYMRTGNNHKHEHTFQLGAIGIDIASEGPFSKASKASYLFNYRYSTLGLLAPLLPENAAGTTYQDLSFKLNFPSRKLGTFSIWGIGLLDHSDATPVSNVKNWMYDSDRDSQNANQYMGAVGISHHILLSDKCFLKTTLAVTGNGISLNTDRLDSALVAFPVNDINNKYLNVIATSYLNTKLDANHTNKSGFVVTNMTYRMLLREADGTPLQTIVTQNGHSTLLAAYSNSLVDLGSKTTLNVGVTGQWFLLNNSWSIEPRAGIKYRLTPSQSLSIAYGLHSRLERLNYYFIKDISNQYLNKSMGFSKAHHLILGYNIATSEFTHLKIETYYQHLFDVPVIVDSSYSLINQQNDWFFSGALQNAGKGMNYGIDFTFEKFLSEGYYYLATASLFNSRYLGGDNVWRDTRYNRNYALNLLVGKEWLLGEEQNQMLGINARISYQGGNHYTPVNVVQSIAVRDVVFDETRAFSQQYSPALLGHLTISYKLNGEGIAHEVSLKVINATQYAEDLGFSYNHHTQAVDAIREVTFIPNLSYRVEF